MDKIYQEYRDVNGQTYEIECYYELGGWNYFSGIKKPRGYYFSICPVTINHTKDGHSFKTITAFTGKYELLFEVKRKSKSADAKARDMITEDFIQSRLSMFFGIKKTTA